MVLAQVDKLKMEVSFSESDIGKVREGQTATVEADGKEETKTITTGLVGDENTEVISGLKAGEKLVLSEPTVATGGTLRLRGAP